ncbi:uncharacterized protein LOC108035139 [Drosophila biarmipes]|uniref:uncharacterized protein LOC108035139 n=1 Tax=Drosophila biarmipes TaxID=125945 RepID=UPI0007E80D51|nr:uncharacterized protein LOC108035139 [Drosophila biarmipes]
MFKKLLPILCLYGGRRTYSMCCRVCSIPTTNKTLTGHLLKAPNFGLQGRGFGTHIVIRHSNDRFYIDIGDQRAELVYYISEGVMTIKSTQVPKELGGHGIGKLLAKAALDYALLNGHFIVIKCRFVQHYIDKYEPQYAKYILN